MLPRPLKACVTAEQVTVPVKQLSAASPRRRHASIALEPFHRFNAGNPTPTVQIGEAAEKVRARVGRTPFTVEVLKELGKK